MERDYLLEFLLYVGTPNFPISLVKYFSSLPKALFLTLEVTIGATIIAVSGIYIINQQKKIPSN